MRQRNTHVFTILAAVGVLLLASCTDEGGASSEVTTSASVQDDAKVTSLSEVTVQRIDYPTLDGTDPEQNWGDLYLPAGQQNVDSIPLVVLIHGGAWQAQLGANLFDPFARDLAAKGMAVYNIEYRRVGSGGGWPTTFEDVSQALDNVVAIDKKFPQLETTDALVVGHSAGAQLAVWGGTRHKLDSDEVGSNPKFRPTKVISLAGPLDMVQAVKNGDDRIVTALGGTPSQVPDRYTSVDPIQNIDPGTPVIAVHGTADTVVLPSLSQRYVDAVEKQNGTGKVILLDGEDHGSIVTSTKPVYRQVIDIITDASGKSATELDE
ncbi:prolyl oligopeptidase family protein [Williamsia limnetica]|jgi:dipeptidyl aminopeptidase/acylaminoacyl peptidase|uniref:Prolyl oligopeptidase family protein n=1 Tax=Williamsia limnetica TaxID=882452 RepID=A0A318RSP1_WILLI|nr:alpha/beta fold hydrolase [Williamsia limnetica]PYE20751.1 prolyl oligopeptidase family protein [Williamsia limnetica]